MPGRRLYHYTALHHADEIRASGAIARGGIPIPDADGETLVGVAPGWQWLTTSDDWRQSWATRQTIRCDRTECRLVVSIPLLELERLQRWDTVAPLFGYTTETQLRLGRLGGGSDATSSSWYVFKGRIPYAWVVGVERRPGLVLTDPRRAHHA